MIIITADDYGKSEHATDSILKCFSNKQITSASAMVFMEDSQRAAMLALETNIEVGLHLNFTMPFSTSQISSKLREHQNRVVSYLNKHKLSKVIYNPLLAGSFDFLFKAQLEEFIRLYGMEPSFYNGHHHMHLCANMLLSKLIPQGARMRNTFTFSQGEKNLFNLFYRRIIKFFISRMFISTDCFFSIMPVQNYERLLKIFNCAISSNVEIEVHPENSIEIKFLLSDQYLSLTKTVHVGNFKQIIHRS